MKGAPRELHRTVVFQGKKFSVEQSSLELPNGRTTTFEAVRHPGAVVIVPCTADGELLMIRQYRHALRATILELPAGTLEPGEAPAACAAREIIEEVGQKAGALVELGILFPAPGFCDEKQFLFFASDLTPAYAPADDDEVIEVVSMTLAAVMDSISSGELCDAKSIAAIARAKARNLL